MSRTAGSFSQLVEYCEKGRAENDDQYNHFHNLHPGQKEQIIRDFQSNAEHLHERKNGVKLYHEILSFSRAKGISNERQKEILRETVAEYLQQRAPDCMAYSVIHDEKEGHLHAHIVISSNRVESSKRHRLSKYDFDKVKKGTEKHVLDKYPEMEQGLTIDKVSKRRKSNPESELKRRGGRTTQKDQLHSDLKEVFSSARTEAELEKLLADRGFAMSYRSGNRKSEPRFGKADSKKHFRLKTLGLDTHYAQCIDTCKAQEAIDSEPAKTSNGKNKTDALKTETAEKVKEVVVSEKGSKKHAQKKPEKSPKRANEYPWQADIGAHLTGSQKPGKRETAEKVASEWIKGDFSERDKEAQRAKYEKQNEADKKVKSRKEQSFRENLGEDLKEVFLGDFEASDARTRKEKFEKLKRDSKKVKSVADQKKTEKFKEKFDEYAKGDFSARDARKHKTDNQERVNEAEKKARDDWFEKDGTKEFVNEKVQQADKAEKERLIRVQERKSTFKRVHSKSAEKAGKKGPEKDGYGK